MGSNPTRPASTHADGFVQAEPTIRSSACAVKILSYLVKLEKDGYHPQTISSNSRILRLLDKNCRLEDPEGSGSS